MRILLTNDDGYDAPGLEILHRIARRFSDDIWIVAPSDENSGAGHSLTLTRPLRIRNRGPQRFSVDGTPTDSVMMAVARLMKDAPPDLILSGVNRGANLGEDVTYSGTVSAAMEGALAGVPSIALSQAFGGRDIDPVTGFAAALEWGARVLEPLIARQAQGGAESPIESRTLVNINFPACPPADVRGVRVVTQGIRDYGRLQIVTNTDPRGNDYHWFALGPMVETPAHSTDLEAIADGYVAVTPLHLDLTYYGAIKGLRALFDG